VVNGDGTITYTPDGTFVAAGGDSFTYIVSDLFGGEAQGSVAITISNSNPVAAPDAAGSAGEAIVISVLVNDTDDDGDSLSVTDVTQGQHGTVSVKPDSTITFTPDGSFPGSGGDLFSYTISDGFGGTSTATVTISALNTPPVASDDVVRIRAGVNSIAVLDNDTDANGNALTISETTNGAHGAVAISGNFLNYTPNATFTGMDTFTYTITDAFGGTDTAEVKVFDELLAAPTGVYRGLVSGEDQESFGTSEVRLSAKGKFTVQLWHSGERFGGKGQFDANGATTFIAKGKGATRTVTLQLAAEEDSVAGAVTNSGAVFPMALKRMTARFGRNAPCPQAGSYTALLPTDPAHVGESTYPQGSGYATMSVTAKGSVKIGGKLGDASSFAIRSSVDQDGVVLMHTPLYKKPKGFICGAATFVSGDPAADQRGHLTWRKPAQLKGNSSYPAGFTGSTEWQASRFVKVPKNAPIFGGAAASLQFGGLPDGVTKPVAAGALGFKVQNSNADTPALHLKGENGLISGSYIHPRDGKKHPLGGVLYQKLTIVRGTFEGVADAGQEVTGCWSLDPVAP